MNISSIKLSNSALAPVAYASICEAIMTDLMFEVPSQGKKNITITKAYAEEKDESRECPEIEGIK